MEFVKAKLADLDEIERLLYQVHDTHAVARPDIFKKGIKKYSKEELIKLLADENFSIYVVRNDVAKIVAHAFIKYEYQVNKVMYIDDICVDKEYRHQGICKFILNNLEDIAKINNYYRITLNVYTFNEAAVKCYENFGMEPYSMHMEKIIKEGE